MGNLISCSKRKKENEILNATEVLYSLITIKGVGNSQLDSDKIDYWLEKGAQPHTRLNTTDSSSSFDIALSTNNKMLIDKFIKVIPNNKFKECLIRAIDYDNAYALKKSLTRHNYKLKIETSKRSDSFTKRLDNLLDIAVKKERINSVKFLLVNGANPDNVIHPCAFSEYFTVRERLNSGVISKKFRSDFKKVEKDLRAKKLETYFKKTNSSEVNMSL